MRVALELWGGDPNQLLHTILTAERNGLDAAYVGESPTPLNAEAWTMVAAAAVATSRIRIGPVITNVLPDHRHPRLLAAQAAAVARLSGGRLDLRTGVGAARSFGAAWWEPAGIPYPDYDRRLDLLDDFLASAGGYWRGELAADHVPPPVLVAANGARARELVTRHRAEWWEVSGRTLDEVAEDRRSGPKARLSVEVDGFVAADEAAVGALRRRVERARAGEDVDALWRRAVTGTPEQVAGRLREYRSVGVDQVLVALHDPHDEGAIIALGRAARSLRR